MEIPETTQRADEIEKAKRAILDVSRVAAEILLIERELDLKRRELHQLVGILKKKRQEISLTPAEQKEFGEWFQLDETKREWMRRPLINQMVEVERRLELIGKEDVECLFDCPQPLQVTVCYPDRPSETVDIFESVKSDPRNIGHPLIVEAIRRYILIIADHVRASRKRKTSRTKAGDNVEMARSNLDRIFRALIVGAEKKNDRQNEYSFLFSAAKYDSGYFESLWNILQEPGIKNALRSGTKLARIKQRLLETHPEEGHEDTLGYLREVFSDNSKLKLPARGGSDALRNAFLGWQHKISSKSAKVYFSKSQRLLKEVAESLPADFDFENLFSAKEKQIFLEEFFLRSFSLGKMRPYEDLAKLVKVDLDEKS